MPPWGRLSLLGEQGGNKDLDTEAPFGVHGRAILAPDFLVGLAKAVLGLLLGPSSPPFSFTNVRS